MAAEGKAATSTIYVIMNLGAMTSRAPLARHGREVSSVFDLLGLKENDLTAALAFTPGRSPALLNLILHRLAPGSQSEQPRYGWKNPMPWGGRT